ncbi:CAP-Gly domain-containing linker protein 1-like isoform X3 [Macrobrachium rosenbergii]|uniref:CAP-Gly domain-containing linker protein 1-like isoform X3 n=2 Tax=Macrobrachium rosenbergii TaxID=79674 RepID=UPI0034D766A2
MMTMNGAKYLDLRSPSPVRRVASISSPVSELQPLIGVKIAPLSTSSPSAHANGDKVDVEIEKLRRLSEEFIWKRESSPPYVNGTKSPENLSQPTSPVFSNFTLRSPRNSTSPIQSPTTATPVINSSTKPINSEAIPHYKRARSPFRENGTAPSPILENKKTPEDPFLPFTLPDLPSYKMPSQRRFSEDFRRPLDTLHENETVSRRRFSEDVRKKSLDTMPVMDDIYQHQRRLSEAGVRRLSDASVVLTEDTDSFIIGDRVWVGGTKGGSISYIGETQFAPGEWAGVTLDEPIGKNDGSVAGVRYFQCEAKKGVFSRLTRLSRMPLTDHDIEILATRTPVGSDSPKANGTPTGSVASGPTAARKITPSSASSPSPAKSSSPAPAKAGSPAPVKAGSPAPVGSATPRKASTSSLASGPPSSEPKIGDRVIINSTTGIKHGILRFVGKTDFAEGIWSGVELDEPKGKNDGSVAGKKYFECKDKYGLFAPVARVCKFSASSAPRRTSVGPQTPRSTIPRSRSKESLGGSSVASSTTSSVRGTRVRLGVTSLLPGQEALTEKTQHVDQLMRERDLERAEVARMAAQTDEATREAQDMRLQLEQLQVESEERIHDLGERIRMLEKEREDLLTKLEDKQRDLDDFSFRLEEESITKADLENQNATDSERIRQLEKELEEAKRTLKDRGALEATKTFEMEELEISLRASVEELQGKIMDIEKEKEELETKLAASLETIKNMETTNESLKNDIREHEQKIKLMESGQEKVNVNMQEIKEKETKIQELQKELQKNQEQIKDASIHADKLTENINQEKQEKDLLHKELEGVKQEITSKCAEMATVQAELTKAQEESKVKSSQLEEANKKVADMKKEVEHLISASHHHRDDLQKQLAQVQVDQAAMAEIQKTLEGERARLDILQGSLAASEEEKSSMKEEKRRLEEELAKMKEGCKSVEDEKTNLVKEKDKLLEEKGKKIKELEDDCTKVSEEKMKLEEAFKNKTESLEAENSKLLKEKSILEGEVQGLKKSEEEKARLGGDIQKLELELTKMTQLQETNTRLMNDIDKLEGDKTSLSSKLETLEKELKARGQVEEENKKLTSTLKASEEEKLKLNEEVKKLDGEMSKMKQLQEDVVRLTSELENAGQAKAQLSLNIEAEGKLKTQLEEEKCKLESNLQKEEEEKRKLQESLTKLETELVRMNELQQVNANLTDDLKKFNEEKTLLSTSVSNLEEELKVKSKLEEEIASLNSKIQDSDKERLKMEEDTKRLNVELSKMNELQEMNSKLTQDLKKLNEELTVLSSDKAGLDKVLENKKQVEEESGKLKAALASSEEEKQKLADEVKRLETEAAEKCKILEGQCSEIKKEVSSLQEEKNTMEADKLKLEEEIQKLKKATETNTALELKNTALVKEMEEIRMSSEGRIAELETEKFNLIEDVVSLQDQLSASKSEVAENAKKQEYLEGEATAANNLRSKVNTLETEKRNLEKKIVDLQVQVASKDITNNDTDNFFKQLKEEKDQLEGQVAFLNSVIVDMQRKNDELKTRLEVMQLGTVPDENRNGVSPAGRHPVAPRMYCDICDCFDAHDTEECPKQASSESPPPTQYHGERGSTRPYCDTCEVFGHETGECNDDETF